MAHGDYRRDEVLEVKVEVTEQNQVDEQQSDENERTGEQRAASSTESPQESPQSQVTYTNNPTAKRERVCKILGPSGPDSRI